MLQINPEQSDRSQSSQGLAVINHTMLIAPSCSDTIREAGQCMGRKNSAAALSQFLSNLQGDPKGLLCAHETEFSQVMRWLSYIHS